MSSFIVVSSYCICNYEANKTPDVSKKVATGVSLSLGLLKEMYDLTGRGNASFKDITADVIGILIGLFVFTSPG